MVISLLCASVSLSVEGREDRNCPRVAQAMAQADPWAGWSGAVPWQDWSALPLGAQPERPPTPSGPPNHSALSEMAPPQGLGREAQEGLGQPLHGGVAPAFTPSPAPTPGPLLPGSEPAPGCLGQDSGLDVPSKARDWGPTPHPAPCALVLAWSTCGGEGLPPRSGIR